MPKIRVVLEPLERRTLFSNILVSVGPHIREYDEITGEFLRQVAVPGGESQDLVSGPDGRIYVYNGDFGGDVSPPRISIYDPKTGKWDDLFYDGHWGAQGTGNLGIFGKYLFAERNAKGNSYPLRFDLETGEAREFGPKTDANGNVVEGLDMRDLVVAPSGIVYVLEFSYSSGPAGMGQVVHLYDPETLEEIDRFSLVRPGGNIPIAGLAVRADGDIFLGGLYHYDPVGNLIGTADGRAIPLGWSTTDDADLRDDDGLMIFSTRTGHFLLTDDELVRYEFFAEDIPWARSAYVAFGTLAPEPLEANASRLVGKVYVDVNGDGHRQSNEGRLGARSLFLDADGDLIYDAEEMTALTDNNGNYDFPSVPPGKYTLCQTAPSQWHIARGVIVVEPAEYVRHDLASHWIGGTVSGLSFDDRNGNGLRDAREPALPGMRVFIDTNGDGSWQRSEVYQFTDGDGWYEFTGLAAGTHRIAQSEPMAGWEMTTPRQREVTLALNEGRANHFGSRDLSGDVTGNVFADIVGDGLRSAGDYMLGGFRAFLDINGDGWWNRNEPFARTNEEGRYTLADIPFGLYWLRVAHVNGWRFTTSEAVRVRVTPDGAVIRHFGVMRNILVTGNVFMDANRSGMRDPAESGLPAWRVFVDADGDGVLDDDEYSVLTDADGHYAIGVLPGGTHQVRIVGSPNYRPTTPPTGYHVVAALPGEAVGEVTFGQKRIVAR